MSTTRRMTTGRLLVWTVNTALLPQSTSRRLRPPPPPHPLLPLHSLCLRDHKSPIPSPKKPNGTSLRQKVRYTTPLLPSPASLHKRLVNHKHRHAHTKHLWIAEWLLRPYLHDPSILQTSPKTNQLPACLHDQSQPSHVNLFARPCTHPSSASRRASVLRFHTTGGCSQIAWWFPFIQHL
jgi:hypothetical protein